MKKFLAFVKNLDGYLVALFLIIMALAAVLQVLNRNIFKLPISWTEEVSRYSMIWMTMLGTALGVRKGMQMSVVLFGKRVKGRLLKGLTIFKNVMMMAFSGVVMVTAVTLMITQANAGQVSTALKLPLQFVSLAIFVGMLMICVFEIWEVIKTIRTPWTEFKPVIDEEPQQEEAESLTEGGPAS